LAFASSALTTVGIIGIPIESSDGIFFLTALYILTGVPIAAAALGNLASKITDPYRAKRTDSMIHSPFDDDERVLLQHLNPDTNETFDKYEYLVFLLVRGGKLDVELLKRVFEKFEELDFDNEGRISISNLIMRYDKVKTSGPLDIDLNLDSDLIEKNSTPCVLPAEL
jgi:hypothetical protein